MAKQKITEEEGVHKAWKEEATTITDFISLCKFLEHITEDYEHDYGTIVHAMEAGMMATFNVMNKSSQGGVTGFQASCLGWALMRKMGLVNEGPARIQDFDRLLYPQYAYVFTTISPKVWEWAQKQAAERLKEHEDGTSLVGLKASEAVIAHWKSIVAGVVPFGLEVVAD